MLTSYLKGGAEPKATHCTVPNIILSGFRVQVLHGAATVRIKQSVFYARAWQHGAVWRGL